MSKIWVGTNWKMTKTIAEGISYTKELKQIANKLTSDIELFIIPSHTALVDIKKEVSNSRIKIGAQNMHWEDTGAYTGEISPKMLDEIGLDLVELGHSERRQYFNENDTDINKKVVAALKYGMQPLVCIGENIQQKNNGISLEVLAAQLKVCLKGLTEVQAQQVLIAYEPVWAIGTGKTASSQQAQDMHAVIRKHLAGKYGQNVADNISILYGGSVNAANAKELFACPDVDGGLVGGASLKSREFTEIIKSV